MAKSSNFWEEFGKFDPKTYFLNNSTQKRSLLAIVIHKINCTDESDNSETGSRMLPITSESRDWNLISDSDLGSFSDDRDGFGQSRRDFGDVDFAVIDFRHRRSGNRWWRQRLARWNQGRITIMFSNLWKTKLLSHAYTYTLHIHTLSHAHSLSLSRTRTSS